MKNNFLNNQNYILWKTEKKNLLSNFFVYRSIKNMYVYFTKLEYFFYKISKKFFNWYQTLLFIVIICICSFLIYKWYLYILVFSFFISFFLFIYNVQVPKKYPTINSIKRFIISDKRWTVFFKVIWWVIWLFSGWTLYINIMNLLEWKNPFNKYVLLALIWVWIIFLWKKFNFTKIKVLNCILFPFIFLYYSFFALISSIYVFIIKWIKWYIFIKNKPQQNLSKKFSKIYKYEMENEFYKVRIKL